MVSLSNTQYRFGCVCVCRHIGAKEKKKNREAISYTYTGNTKQATI